MAEVDKVETFPAISVSDEKDKCIIFLTVPGMKTKKPIGKKRKAENVEITCDIQEKTVKIKAVVTLETTTETYEYNRNMPDTITTTGPNKSKLEVEQTQLRLLLTKATSGRWTQFDNYLHCLE